jgi:hypothetical protein
MISIILLASIPFSAGLCLWAAGALYHHVRRKQFQRYGAEYEQKRAKLRVIK